MRSCGPTSSAKSPTRCSRGSTASPVSTTRPATTCAVVHAILSSPEFWDPSVVFALLVAGGVRGAGDQGDRLGRLLGRLGAEPDAEHGQALFEPPDVNGWDLGQGWFSTGAMLNWMNYAASLTTNQRINLRDEARLFAQTPQGVMSFVMSACRRRRWSRSRTTSCSPTCAPGTNWTASDNELRAKVAGVMHLVLGSSDTSWFEASWHSQRRDLLAGGGGRRVHLGRRAGVPVRRGPRPGAASRNLVVLYLGGGNDSLNTVVPCTVTPTTRVVRRSPSRRNGAADRERHQRQRPRPAPEPDRPPQHLQPGPHGRHPAHGYPNLSRSHFLGN